MAFVRQYAGRSDEPSSTPARGAGSAHPAGGVDAKSPSATGRATGSPPRARRVLRDVPGPCPRRRRLPVYGWWPAYRNRELRGACVDRESRRADQRHARPAAFRAPVGSSSRSASRRACARSIFHAEPSRPADRRGRGQARARPAAGSERAAGRRPPGGRHDSSALHDARRRWSRRPSTPPDAAARGIRAVDFAHARDGPPGRPPGGPAQGLTLFTTRNGPAGWSHAELPAPGPRRCGARLGRLPRGRRRLRRDPP